MTDIWACSKCHSINRQRNSTCYKCGAKQEQASADIANVRTEQAILNRAVTPYRRSILRALVASAFIVAYAVVSIVLLIESVAVYQFIRDQIPALAQGEMDAEFQQEFIRLLAPAVVPSLLKTVFGIGALLFFAAWLSRVVMNIPALGGGMPNTTPTKAFIYPLIPFWNLLKTPPMIHNALYRLDPKAGGFFMVLVAWVGLVGSAIVGFLAGWWVNLRLATVAPRADTLGDAIAVIQGAFDMQFIVDLVTTLMASIGAIVLVLIIFRIESRAAARDREIRKTAFAPRPEPGSVEARPGAVNADAAAGPIVASAAAPASPAPPELVPGPFGFEPAAAVASEDFDDRPIAVRERPEAPPPIDPPPAVGSPAGPRLLLRIEDDGTMIATLEGESEPIKIEELRAAADALAGADGSAVIETVSASFGALSLAEQAFAIFSNARVPTSIED
ncbi:MAG TPA: DUF4328 domain-containing protein [Actinomycetota bacterium]|nr:DUF4328 domain-containing protein [Actinomycetota bacterium]